MQVDVECVITMDQHACCSCMIVVSDAVTNDVVDTRDAIDELMTRCYDHPEDIQDGTRLLYEIDAVVVWDIRRFVDMLLTYLQRRVRHGAGPTLRTLSSTVPPQNRTASSPNSTATCLKTE